MLLPLKNIVILFHMCEIAAYRNFVKPLADAEIHVDGIANMRVRNQFPDHSEKKAQVKAALI
jgi:hypothetical protein